MDYNGAKCPECGGKLIQDDAFDFDFEPSSIDVECIGHCQLCGKTWLWMDHYKYDHSDSYNDQLEEYAEDEEDE